MRGACVLYDGGKVWMGRGMHGGRKGGRGRVGEKVGGWAGFITAAHAGDELMRFCAAKADPRTALEAEAYAARPLSPSSHSGRAAPQPFPSRGVRARHSMARRIGVGARGYTPSEHSGVCPMAVIVASVSRLLRG